MSTSFVYPTENSLKLINLKILFENYTFHIKCLYILCTIILHSKQKETEVIESSIKLSYDWVKQS